MKKSIKIISLLLAAAISAPLAGCGKQQAKDGRITISFSNMPDQEAKPADYKAMTEKIARFEEKNPDIHVVGDTWGYDTQSFAAKAEGGTLPTVYKVPFTETKKLMDLGYAADVTEQIKSYGYYDLISDYCMENISVDGKVYYMPDAIYSMNLMQNLNLFREAGLMDADDTPKVPATYDELLSMAKTIKEKTGKAGFIIPTTNNLGGWQFTMIAWGFGAKFMEKKDGKYVACFDSPECTAALQFIKDMKWKHHVLPESTLVNWEDQMKLFATDQCAMSIANPNTVTGLFRYGMDKNNVGIAKIPAGPAKRVTLVGGNYYTFSTAASPEQIDAAFKWLTFENDILNFDDDAKAAMEADIALEAETSIVGLNELSVWNTSSEYQRYKDELTKKYANINLNHVKNFNDQTGVEYQSEEPACTQDLYSTLDACIQEVLTNENADCAAILKQANADFQANFLDYE